MSNASAADSERFHLLVEGVKEYAIFMLDPQGRVMTWNAGARRIKGYDDDEILGQHYSIFFVDDDVKAGRPQRLLRDAAAEGRAKDEGWRVRKDGSRFWADALVTALFDERGLIRGFAKITRDDTDRRITELRSRQLGVLRDRERIAADVNASVIGRIYRVGLGLAGVERLTSDPQVEASISEAVEELDQVIRDLRAIVFAFNDDPAPPNEDTHS
jgi:PAS domain S-box-containing protein